MDHIGRIPIVTLILSVCVLGLGRSMGAQEPQDPVDRMAQRIDYWVLGYRGEPIGGEATDAEFLRRAYLDLTGVIPDAAVTLEFLDQSDPNKRTRLVDTLVDSPGFSVRLADHWTQLLLPDNADNQLPQERESLRRWLLDRFSENVRYDRIVADLLISSGDPTEQPTAFFTASELKPEKLAERTCRVFLGVALDCAQCHDHPFDRWKQKDFWGVAAYFARIKSNGNPNQMMSGGILDVDEGEVQIPETSIAIAPKPLLENTESSLAIGSRRQQLAIWVTSKQNSWFAKAAVNRVWAMLMGRGIVEPVDDIGEKSFATHPELLQDLTVFFQSNQYDLRKLVLAITRSQTYRRSSRSYREDASQPAFLWMRPKPLTAHQVAASLRHVARHAKNGPMDPWAAMAQKLGKIQGEASEYTGGVLQSLLLQHSPEMESIWRETESNLIRSLEAPHIPKIKQVDWMYLAVLSRLPSDSERIKIDAMELEYGQDAEQRRKWIADFLWAMINSSEFGITP